MKFTVADKEYTIKFGYEVTAKSKIMSLVAKTDNKPIDENEDMATAMMGAVEDTMTVLAKMLLVGLQRFHSDEFGYDYNETDLDKVESMSKVYELLDTYFDDEIFCFQSVDKSKIEGIMLPEHLSNLAINQVNCLPNDLSCYTRNYINNWLNILQLQNNGFVYYIQNLITECTFIISFG